MIKDCSALTQGVQKPGFSALQIIGIGVDTTGSSHTTVLSNLHHAIWWGVFIFLLGLFYTIKFWPKKNSSN